MREQFNALDLSRERITLLHSTYIFIWPTLYTRFINIVLQRPVVIVAKPVCHDTTEREFFHQITITVDTMCNENTCHVRRKYKVETKSIPHLNLFLTFRIHSSQRNHKTQAFLRSPQIHLMTLHSWATLHSLSVISSMPFSS